MTWRRIGQLGLGGILVLCFINLMPMVKAEPLASPNYRFDESTLGSGGFIQSSSDNYRATGATGGLSVGDTSSSNYNVSTGTVTSPDPTLSFAITKADATFGRFSANTPTTATASFSVKNYTSYGYVVQIIGAPPKYGGHTITAMNETGASVTGTEQFGINLVKNTTPVAAGADPDNGEFGHGEAAPNYATPGSFRYVSGETIAYAPKSSGETIYTLTYLVNVAPLTPGGKYTSNQSLVVTGTY